MTGESCCLLVGRESLASLSRVEHDGRVVASADLGSAALSWWWRGPGLLTRVEHDRRWEACLLVGVNPGRCAACPGGAEFDGRDGAGGGCAGGAGAVRVRGRRWFGDPGAWAAGEARPAMVVACGWCACPGSWSRVGHDRRKGRACLWCRDTRGSRPGASPGDAGRGGWCWVRQCWCRWGRWTRGAAGVLQVDQGSSGNARR